MLLWCLNLAFAALLLTPAVLALVWWRRDESRPAPFALAGVALMLISFFILPWLSLRPLDLIGLGWLGEALPTASRLLVLLGIRSLETALRWLGVTGLLTNWRGWLTLPLTTGPAVWIVSTLLGALVFVAAHVVNWTRARWAAWLLLLAAAGLTLLIAYHLPIIDGLGERPYPQASTIALPILAARLHWAGPAVMGLGLALCLIGALHALSEPPPAGPEELL
ncbi:hypothetical protein [Promineifilum sp.]|uniref:hypothetical protein n=1 Tax=Promineifilum sp. TaxID=2664178 RepID=UPI0035AE278C